MKVEQLFLHRPQLTISDLQPTFFFCQVVALTDRLDLSMRHFMKWNTGGDASTATKPSNGPRIQR